MFCLLLRACTTRNPDPVEARSSSYTPPFRDLFRGVVGGRLPAGWGVSSFEVTCICSFMVSPGLPPPHLLLTLVVISRCPLRAKACFWFRSPSLFIGSVSFAPDGDVVIVLCGGAVLFAVSFHAGSGALVAFLWPSNYMSFHFAYDPSCPPTYD